jgi:hypothetical protein
MLDDEQKKDGRKADMMLNRPQLLRHWARCEADIVFGVLTELRNAE